MKTTATFKSQQTEKPLEDKTEYAIYLMEYTICNLQYVGKNEAPFNIRLNNHRKDVKDPKAVLADKHFQKCGLRSNEHATCTIIDTLTNTNFDKEILRERLIQRESFWIQKLESLNSTGLIIEFNMQF